MKERENFFSIMSEEKNQKIEQQNEAILEQSKYLESINHVKDKLFSIVSHDLKDSLTSTQGFIDLLKEGSLSDEEFNSLIPELSENADNASSLLLNLLKTQSSLNFRTNDLQSKIFITSAFFFFTTNELGFEPEFLGRVRLVTSIASLIGIFIFQKFLNLLPPIHLLLFPNSILFIFP